jgi:HEAT repeat protein
MAGHALRETARDTLFLTSLPATRLPWAYLAIAALALTLGSGTRVLLAHFSQRRLLACTLAVGSLVDLAFWWLSAEEAAAWLFAFYVWTGLISTAVTMQFWLHLAGAFAVDEAKRSFAPIAAGGLVGAVAGSSAASVLLLVLPTHSLLVASSMLFGASALLPWLLPPRLEPEPETQATAPTASMSPRELLGNRYLRRLLALALLAAVVGTAIDFAFKSGAAQTIPTPRLGHFFARFQTAVNVAALLFQVALAPFLLRSFGVIRALALLPSLLLAGSAALLASPGLLPVALLRGADGTLRHSLHRAGSEVLYLPLDAARRATFRTLADSIGHRGGQALASLGILLLVAVHADTRVFAVALAAISALMLLALVGLRTEYVARFREQLRGLRGDPRSEVPRLDLHSLEVLVGCLSSPNDTEVLSSLDVLEACDKTSLVPPLILHHPSRAVVLRALEQFSQSGHPHLDSFLARLLSHDDSEVRAAALRAYAARAPADARVRELLRGDPSPTVRATALVVWLARHGEPGELERLAGEILDGEDRVARLALARALPNLPYAAIASPLRRLLADPDESVVAELAQAATANPRAEQIPLLIALLGRRAARRSARDALAALGDAAIDALTGALRSDATPDTVRRHLPRALARVGGPRVVRVLIEALDAADPRVCFQAARGLGRLRDRDASLPVPVEPLERAAVRSLERVTTLLCHGATCAAWSGLRSPEAAEAVALLQALLEEEQRRALERVFRLLHVLEPEHGYAEIFHGLRSGGVQGAGSREMVEHLVEGRLRDGILAVVETAAAPLERLRNALAFYEPPGAKRLLDLVARRSSPALSNEELEELEALAEACFADVESDADAILASAARRCRRAAAPLHLESTRGCR